MFASPYRFYATENVGSEIVNMYTFDYLVGSNPVFSSVRQDSNQGQFVASTV